MTAQVDRQKIYVNRGLAGGATLRWPHLETRDAHKQFRDRGLQGRIRPIFRVHPKFRRKLDCMWRHLNLSSLSRHPPPPQKR